MAIETVMERTDVNPLVAQAVAPYETIEVWAPGTVLFREGQQPTGVFFVHSGEVDLCFSSPRAREAKALLTAEAGQILGLTCVMSGRPHDCSATTRTTAITGFVARESFLKLLDQKPDLWLTVLQMISTNINQCWDCMRNIAVAR